MGSFVEGDAALEFLLADVTPWAHCIRNDTDIKRGHPAKVRRQIQLMLMFLAVGLKCTYKLMKRDCPHKVGFYKNLPRPLDDYQFSKMYSPSSASASASFGISAAATISQIGVLSEWVAYHALPAY